MGHIWMCLSVQRFPETNWALESHTHSHTYKGVENYKYRTGINRIDIPCAGWIREDICVCESVCLCVPWVQVSIPMTCPPSVLPSFNSSFRLSFNSLARVIKQRLVWHKSERDTQTAIMPLKVHLSHYHHKAVICSGRKDKENRFSRLLKYYTWLQF